jgi:N6-adenosine-specific RNA methylase IME4
MNPPTQESAVLFQAENIFLLDIPHSIALAQEGPAPPIGESGSGSINSSHRKIPKLRSCAPLKEYFPSTEPKKPAALARVLESIPVSERRFHAELILPLVRDALEIIRAGFPSQRRWCFSRALPGEDVGIPLLSEGPRKRRRGDGDESTFRQSASDDQNEPPIILSTTSPNEFESLLDLKVVKNPSQDTAIIRTGGCETGSHPSEYIIPPESSFVLGTLPLFQTEVDRSSTSKNYPIPGLPKHQKFNLILMDPPWPNRSVRRSGHYQTHHYSEMEVLTQGLRDILRAHSHPEPKQRLGASELQIQSEQSIAAIWITNAEKSRRAAYEALTGSGFRIHEEWVWIKTTWDGEPISALDGLWRKPYEILVVGIKDGVQGNASPLTLGDDLTRLSEAVTTRRVIAAVPDLHSRKPNLKAIFEEVFFTSSGCVRSYSALEVFARNLTAGWWGVGNEVLRFNARECWVDPDIE